MFSFLKSRRTKTLESSCRGVRPVHIREVMRNLDMNQIESLPENLSRKLVDTRAILEVLSQGEAHKKVDYNNLQRLFNRLSEALDILSDAHDVLGLSYSKLRKEEYKGVGDWF